MEIIESRLFRICFRNREDCLWSYKVRGTEREFMFAPPSFEIDGKLQTALLSHVAPAADPVKLKNGCTEYTFEGVFQQDNNLILGMVFRAADDNPIVRFHYTLKSRETKRMTKTNGGDGIKYLKFSFEGMSQVKEIRFSEFNEMVHSFCLSERSVESGFFENNLCLMGPMMTAYEEDCSMLAAYEHGSQVPDMFVGFSLSSDRSVELKAVKGNYYHGQQITMDTPYQTIWFQAGAIKGGEDALAEAYRTFVLKYITLNKESRKPYIFYNTWAYQERNKWWNGKKYLDSMNQERILKEIDVAHRMGIDVFVLDTGWYEKTGDWKVNRQRFPDGLKSVKERLDKYGMKLGLWFDPLSAAVSSRILNTHRDCIMTVGGKADPPSPVWETEESQRLCLASRYWSAFADELIRLVKEVGVTYFKWDAIIQFGCNDPGHWHGTSENTEQERADCYAFQVGIAMSRIVDKLCKACPEAIVDFDVTEGHRYMGLGFLASGKYFLINNGPYYHNIDHPSPKNRWINIFVYPGPARGWICRTPLSFDKWIPSVLFLTHYLPDDSHDSQLINICSLILGQNGIWGDLLGVSEEGVKLFGKMLGYYKQVRNDITMSMPVRYGQVGGSPEIHEKIYKETGCGVVVAFSSNFGKYTYVTSCAVAKEYYSSEDVEVTFDKDGRAVLEMQFSRPSARIVFFGVTNLE